MNTTTLQDDKSIDELARRIYVIEGRGGAKKLEQAKDALLKENPQLGNFARLKKGTKINIPEISGITEREREPDAEPSGGRIRIPTREPAPRPEPRPERGPRPDRGREPAPDHGRTEPGGEAAAEGKIPDVAAGLRASVGALDAKLARSDEEVLAGTERQLARLSDPRFRAAADRHPEAAKLSKKLEASLNQRRKELQAAAEERQKVFKEIEEDLGKMGVISD